MKNDAMKKNIVIIAAAAVVVCAAIFGVFKFVNADDAPGGGSASNTGEGLRDGAHILLNEGWAIDLPGSERPAGDRPDFEPGCGSLGTPDYCTGKV